MPLYELKKKINALLDEADGEMDDFVSTLKSDIREAFIAIDQLLEQNKVSPAWEYRMPGRTLGTIGNLRISLKRDINRLTGDGD